MLSEIVALIDRAKELKSLPGFLPGRLFVVSVLPKTYFFFTIPGSIFLPNL